MFTGSERLQLKLKLNNNYKFKNNKETLQNQSYEWISSIYLLNRNQHSGSEFHTFMTLCS